MKPERLTNKNTKVIIDGICDYGCYPTKKAIQKLGKLEDIEEELGVGIVTLHKALKNGIYVYTKSYGILFCKYPFLRFDTPEPLFDISSDYWLPLVEIYLENYGKKVDGGWALTKEELKEALV